MASYWPNEDGTEEGQPEFSLTKAIEDVSQHGYAQTAALQEKQRTLSKLQSTLKGVMEELEMVQQDLRAKVRETLLLEGELEQLEHDRKALNDRCVSTCKENSKLQVCITEEEVNASIALVKFNAYRKKMDDHRAAVLSAKIQTKAYKELEEKRELVRMLTLKKEELEKDLENPNGNTVQMEKREIDVLKEKISAMRKVTEEKREKLQQGFEVHAQLKKEIEIKNRRFEAIVRRLHCQLSRAQAVYRQQTEVIYGLERQLNELKRQLEPSQDSAVVDH
ncbi:coiled-coil domain-containing protein 122-like [Cheilinus undulatus]|uniref:coiled-coil domain-containing protein 122-like n=1 Tax=Cheilinus undulatus TaxID=241271 RepID=UPI001BD5FE4F|nr:coiled-coil domain-containing protein 122-like [Cheilinus undulatus]